MSLQHRKLGIRGGGLVAAGLLVLVPMATEVRAQSPNRDRKMNREIHVMENILDQVVIDSRNVLVPSRHSVHGVYLPEFGVMFTTEASLLHRDWDWDHDWNWRNIEHKGDKIIIHKNSWEDEDDDDDVRDKSGKTWSQRRKERSEKLYTQAKVELIDALLDYGDTISGLKDTESIGLTVYLGDDDYFDDLNFSRLVMKARMSDIRAYSEGRIDRKQMEARLTLDEY